MPHLAAAKGETMFYRKNMGATERALRLVAGAMMVAFAFAVLGIWPRGWLLAAGGVMVVATGMVGFCPACALVGRRAIERPPP
jgi:hypothetical protein